jgi:hypothetical protein
LLRQYKNIVEIFYIPVLVEVVLLDLLVVLDRHCVGLSTFESAFVAQPYFVVSRVALIANLAISLGATWKWRTYLDGGPGG